MNKSKKNLFFLLIGVSLISFSGCFWSNNDQKKNSDFYLVNVLDKSFFDDCHIPGSLNISMNNVEKTAASWPKTATIVIYCSNYSCETSGWCCKKLQKAGFKSVWDYDEGTAGWYQAHQKDPEAYPIIGPGKEKYLTMKNEPFGDSQNTQPLQVKVISTEKLKEMVDAHKEQE